MLGPTRRRLRGLVPHRLRRQRRVPPSAARAEELVRVDELLPCHAERRTYNGKVYGAMNSTDVQLIYYSKKLFKQAGLPATWQPHNWADVLSAARAIEAHNPVSSRCGSTRARPWARPRRSAASRSSSTGRRTASTTTRPTSGRSRVPGSTQPGTCSRRCSRSRSPSPCGRIPNADATVDLTLIPHQQVGIVFDGSWVATAFVPGRAGTVARLLQRLRGGGHPHRRPGRSRVHEPVGRLGALGPEPGPHPSLSQAFIEAASSAPILASFDPASGNLPAAGRRADPAGLAGVGQGEPGVQVRLGTAPYTTFRPNLPDYVWSPT